MRLLADTHALLWLLADDPRLSEAAADLLADSGNEVLLSAAVVWEVGVKRSVGKLRAPDGFASLLLEGGAARLPITIEHAAVAGELPWHHRDPFDRMLVAQAQVDDAVIVSSDEALHRYAVDVAW